MGIYVNNAWEERVFTNCTPANKGETIEGSAKEVKRKGTLVRKDALVDRMRSKPSEQQN